MPDSHWFQEFEALYSQILFSKIIQKLRQISIKKKNTHNLKWDCNDTLTVSSTCSDYDLSSAFILFSIVIHGQLQLRAFSKDFA